MTTQWIIAIATAPMSIAIMTVAMVKMFKRVLYELQPNDGKSMHDAHVKRFDNLECRIKIIEKDIDFIREAVCPKRDSKGRYTK